MFHHALRVQVGFFRVQRGLNSMMIEDGWCWYAIPDVSMEQAVMEGDYIGSMVSGMPHLATKEPS